MLLSGEWGTSLKLDFRGIRFRIWMTILVLSAGILVLLGVLQIGLIRPYYRNSKISSVKLVADAIEEDLIREFSEEGIDAALQQTIDNNVCVVIYNGKGQKVYDADGLGASCIFNYDYSKDSDGIEYDSGESLISLLNENNGEYSQNLENSRTSQEMIVYGKKIAETFADYYIYVNSPLEPVDSVVSFFARQYGNYMILVLVIASIVAIWISKSVTRPIVSMNVEAKKLANADYSAKFDGGKYTETEQLASTLNEANFKLSKIDELRRDLIANVSHDIRTPLTDIQAYAEMIRDISGDNKEKREKHLNVILRETDYMNRLVNDMSELSKMQTGNYHLNLDNMDLVSSIQDIVEIDGGLLERQNLEVKLDIPDSLTVYADEIKIDQVISNYLSNAIKHSPSGSTIEIRAFRKKDEETARVEVIDHGEGISKEELPYIWDRYEKNSKSFSRSMSNTGLGLAIVKAILDTHHAKYGVESIEGKGSTFWFELKRTQDV